VSRSRPHKHCRIEKLQHTELVHTDKMFGRPIFHLPFGVWYIGLFLCVVSSSLCFKNVVYAFEYDTPQKYMRAEDSYLADYLVLIACVMSKTSATQNPTVRVGVLDAYVHLFLWAILSCAPGHALLPMTAMRMFAGCHARVPHKLVYIDSIEYFFASLLYLLLMSAAVQIFFVIVRTDTYKTSCRKVAGSVVAVFVLVQLLNLAVPRFHDPETDYRVLAQCNLAYRWMFICLFTLVESGTLSEVDDSQ